MYLNNNIKLIVSLMVAVMLSFGVVFALDAPTGDVLKTCNLTIVANEGLGDLDIYLQDIATANSYNFKLAEGEKKVFEIVANTTYDAKTRSSKSVYVINEDGSDVTSYHATETGLTIILKSGVKPISTNLTNTPSASKGSDFNELAAAFFNDMAFIENDENYTAFIGTFSAEPYKLLFLEIKGNTVEKWSAMSPYERACYTLVFTYPRYSVVGKNVTKDEYFENLKPIHNFLEPLPKGEDVYLKLYTIWEVHWSKWKSERIFQESFEIKPKEKVDNVVEVSKTSRETYTSPSIFIDFFKSNIFSVLALIIVAIAYKILEKKRKEKNIDEE